MPAERALFALAPYEASVRYRIDGSSRTLSASVGSGVPGARVEVHNGDVSLTVERSDEPGGAVIASRVTALRTGVALDFVEPLVFFEVASPPDLSVFRNGWQSWSGSSSFTRQDREPEERRLFHIREIAQNPASTRGKGVGVFSSDLCAAVSSAAAGKAMALGFLGTSSQFGQLRLDLRPGRAPRIAAILPFEGVVLEVGETRVAEPLLVLWGDDAAALLERYAGRLGQAMKARVGGASVVGWCSWYQYFDRIDEAKVLQNLDVLAARPDAFPISLVQIDDGYQAAIGDWLQANGKFARGMRAVADEIRQRELVPGLWLAPFIARPGSRLLADHPDWFVQTAAGRPRRALYNHVWSKWDTAKALDLTHPGAQRWLAEVFRTVAHDWGYRFIKLDFLFAASLPGRRHDAGRTGAEALRRGLEIIREAVGDDVHLLGCGCPLGPAVGLVDSMRVAPDVTPYWTDWMSRWMTRDYGVIPSTKAALRNVMSRSFFHRKVWQNDPDCVLLRDFDTRLTADEVRSLATVVALTGGTVLISDDVTRLPRERVEIFGRVVAINAEIAGSTPRCLDLMTSRYPGLLWAARAGGGGYLAVLNPEDVARDLSVELAAHEPLRELGPRVSAREVWSGTPCENASGRLVLPGVPAHGARLLLVEGG